MPMQPMPPQGADDQAPDQGADAGASAGGGPASQLITGIQSDMKKLGALLEKAGTDPEELQEYSSLIQGFESFIEKLAGGGDSEAGAKPEPQAVSSPEAGGNPNARPV